MHHIKILHGILENIAIFFILLELSMKSHLKQHKIKCILTIIVGLSLNMWFVAAECSTVRTSRKKMN